MAFGYAEKLGKACLGASRYEDGTMVFKTAAADAERSGRTESAMQFAALLAESRKLQLATINRDGTPHLVTMFYVMLDGQIACARLYLAQAAPAAVVGGPAAAAGLEQAPSAAGSGTGPRCPGPRYPRLAAHPDGGHDRAACCHRGSDRLPGSAR